MEPSYQSLKLGLPGPNVSVDNHYGGRNNTTFTLSENSIWTSQGTDTCASSKSKDREERIDLHCFHASQVYQSHYHVSTLTTPSLELDALPKSLTPLDSRTLNGVYHHDDSRHPTGGGHATAFRYVIHDMQDCRSCVCPTDSTGQELPQSLQPYVGLYSQHASYSGMQAVNLHRAVLPTISPSMQDIRSGAPADWVAYRFMDDHQRDVNSSFPRREFTGLYSLFRDSREQYVPSKMEQHGNYMAGGINLSTTVQLLDKPNQGTQCPWRDEVGTVCGEWITKGNCAAHLASCHGIKSMSGSLRIKCQACFHANFIKRESMLRHFVEVHIKLRRKPCKRKEKIVIAQHILPDWRTDESAKI